MPRTVKVVNINDDSTYGDVAEAIVENEKQKTNHPKKLKQKWQWNQFRPSLRHEQNECQNLKLLWMIL